jgi:hypothetical protein
VSALVNRVLRVTCFHNRAGHAELRVVITTRDGGTREFAFEFDDAAQFGEAIDKQQLVHRDMLRFPPTGAAARGECA